MTHFIPVLLDLIGLFLAAGARHELVDDQDLPWKVNIPFFSKKKTDGSVNQIQLPPSVPLLDAKNACPAAAHGTLMVGCIGAEDLEFASSQNSTSFCRVVISDMAAMRKFIRYKKPARQSLELRSTLVRNSANPQWNDAFSFHMVCPEMPNTYQVDITLKTKGRVLEHTLGRANIPLHDVMSRSFTGKKTLDLQDGKGKLTVVVDYCAGSEATCIADFVKMSNIAGVKDETTVNCGQDCKRSFLRAANSKIQAVRSQMTVVRLAASAEGLASKMKKVKKLKWIFGAKQNKKAKTADSAEGSLPAENEKAANASTAASAAGKPKESKTEQAWGTARSLGETLHQDLGQIAEVTCGAAVSKNLASVLAFHSTHFDETYSGKARKAAAITLNAISEAVKKLGDQLEEQWWQGHPRPASSANITEDCKAALQA
eukprot:TRINITY_DN19512_c0_g1_i1.p1 TRINITY_DN19512_c0_g1~~TRINITY_DN19512_c0_g1_i1.p1  ORF type:complete len:429 (-),score=75.92 TRINITY_DN19512_c0_g1_i1:225-1511(-)